MRLQQTAEKKNREGQQGSRDWGGLLRGLGALMEACGASAALRSDQETPGSGGVWSLGKWEVIPLCEGQGQWGGVEDSEGTVGGQRAGWAQRMGVGSGL